MLFENRNNQRYKIGRINAWIKQAADLFTGMASTCLVASLISPLLDGNWPSSPGLWAFAGVLLFAIGLLFLNHLTFEDEL